MACEANLQLQFEQKVAEFVASWGLPIKMKVLEKMSSFYMKFFHKHNIIHTDNAVIYFLVTPQFHCIQLKQ
jgi:hypothetical protein